MEDMKIQIKVDTINAILNYLAAQPFKDVQGLIGTVQQEAQAQQAAPEAE